MASVTWQGTEREFARLLEAVDNNCDCVAGMFGLPPKLCAAHALLKQQNTLDHLLYVYRMRKMFITREFYSLPQRTTQVPARRASAGR
jgi:hypothetical protein